MNAQTFTLDTHAEVRRLVASGEKPEVAEAVVDLIARTDATNVATKADVKMVRRDLKIIMAMVIAVFAAVAGGTLLKILGLS